MIYLYVDDTRITWNCQNIYTLHIKLFDICLECAAGCEYTRVLNILGFWKHFSFWICQGYTEFWVRLNSPG